MRPSLSLETSLVLERPTPTTTVSQSRATEHTGLLEASYEEGSRSYNRTSMSTPGSRYGSLMNSTANIQGSHRLHSRRPTGRFDGTSPLFTRSGLRTPKLPRTPRFGDSIIDDRVWYDQFTSTDWVHDSIADGYRALELRKQRGLRGRFRLIFDSAQGWILMLIIGCAIATLAYIVDVTEAAVFDLKRGYCTKGWYYSRKTCCKVHGTCEEWKYWSEILNSSHIDSPVGDYATFILACVIFAMVACLLTLLSKTVIPMHVASTLDENLGADKRQSAEHLHDSKSSSVPGAPQRTMAYYSAAGSGVAEVKIILSGFVLHGYLGFKTLLIKCIALIFSVASGMSLGKEGPYVHIATCIGNIACRIFPKYNLNDGKRREVLSAAAASGVAVAFGSPLGGVLFSLEEVSYYFPPKTLFRTFFCCIAAALTLKFLNPYGTNQIVIFEVRYFHHWRYFELFNFVILGIVGGVAGAAFIKASRFWATTFRRWKPVKSYPWLEVLLVAFITGVVSFWNRHANLAVTELLLELASPCGPDNDSDLCPKAIEDIPHIIGYLLAAFVIKAFLTVITFGIKVPAGIYVPSMVCGGLMGRIFGHFVQYLVMIMPPSFILSECSASDNMEHCITPGVYALVAAGATMCGVTRLSVTLAVILFELTGSLDHVLPFAIGVLTAKWTADWIEPASIYDLLIDMNSYPYMDNRHTPLFDSELGDLTPRFRSERVIDITISPYVRASELRAKLNLLHDIGEFDGGLPIIREKVLVGLVPAPDLEFALDKIEGSEDETLCLMSNADQFGHMAHHKRWFAVLDNDDGIIRSSSPDSGSTEDEEEDGQNSTPEIDLVAFVDPAPVALDTHSPMNLVYQCFSKLGLRYICVVEDGHYRGMVHKKLFVKYLKTCEANLG